MEKNCFYELRFLELANFFVDTKNNCKFVAVSKAICIVPLVVWDDEIAGLNLATPMINRWNSLINDGITMVQFFKRIIGFFAVMAFLGVVSCQTVPPCENGEVLMYGGFHAINQYGVKDTLIDSVSVYLHSASDELYCSNKNLKMISLPLSMQQDSTVFIFVFGKKASDTLVVKHSFDLKLVSHECGFVGFFTLTDAYTTTHCIDSVRIRKDLVNYDMQENIRLHF